MTNIYDNNEEQNLSPVKKVNVNEDNPIVEKGDEKEEDDDENSYIEDDPNAKKEIVIKDELFEKYKNNLFDKFLIWTLGINIEIELSSINLTALPIANINILEIIFALDKEINDINLTFKFFEAINKLITNNQQNSYNLLSNKKVYFLFLETTFKYHKKEEKIEKKLFELGKSILLSIFINSFIYVEKKYKDKYPCYEIDSIFLWGEQTSKSNK